MSGVVITETLKGPNGKPAILDQQKAAKVTVNYNGIAASINESFNLSSVTDNGVGNYTFNFTNAMVTATYVVTQTVGPYGAGNPIGGFYEVTGGKTAGSLQVSVAQAAPLDLASVSMSTVGDLA